MTNFWLLLGTFALGCGLTLLGVVTSLVVFWLLFKGYCVLGKRKNLGRWWRLAFDVYTPVAGLYDLAMNYTVVAVLFCERWPWKGLDWKARLVTARLGYYIDLGRADVRNGVKPDWRYWYAEAIERTLLGPEEERGWHSTPPEPVLA